uniref:Uncharacterized protein n=1 Tax=Salix viminalis TaxID=40686 RepID=A0A6N2KFC3_SALVM
MFRSPHHFLNTSLEKKWKSDMEKSDLLDFKSIHRRAPSFPTLEPQILFKYPPGKRLAMRSKDLAAFCFPGDMFVGEDSIIK